MQRAIGHDCSARLSWASAGAMKRSGRIERADADVIPVGIPERKLHGSRAGIYMRLLFQPADQSTRASQPNLEVVDAEEQEQAIARRRVVGARQRRVLVSAP